MPVEMSTKTLMKNDNRTIIFDELIVHTNNLTVCTYASLFTKRKLLCPFKCPLKYCNRSYMRCINKFNSILLIELTSLKCSEIILYEKIHYYS